MPRRGQQTPSGIGLCPLRAGAGLRRAGPGVEMAMLYGAADQTHGAVQVIEFDDAPFDGRRSAGWRGFRSLIWLRPLPGREGLGDFSSRDALRCRRVESLPPAMHRRVQTFDQAGDPGPVAMLHVVEVECDRPTLESARLPSDGTQVAANRIIRRPTCHESVQICVLARDLTMGLSYAMTPERMNDSAHIGVVTLAIDTTRTGQ